MKIKRMRVTIEPSITGQDERTAIRTELFIEGEEKLTHVREIDDDDFTSLFEHMMDWSKKSVMAAIRERKEATK